MQSNEFAKKLADNYRTLMFVVKRHPSSMSRLKNMLMAEGMPETSARRKIAELETEEGCLVVERDDRLQLNQKLLSKLFLELERELVIPNFYEQEYKEKIQRYEAKFRALEKKLADREATYQEELTRKNDVIDRLETQVRDEKANQYTRNSWEWKQYQEASAKLKHAEEKITRMKKGVFSYYKVRIEDCIEAYREKKRLKREVKERQKRYAEIERSHELEAKKREQEKRKAQKITKKNQKRLNKQTGGNYYA